MPFEPLRFLHATSACLDQSLGETVALAPPLSDVARDASQIAFGRLVAAAVEREADFLLLAGDAFFESDTSLPARVALLEGLRTLGEYDIPVYVAAGRRDPLEAWSSIPDLPANVTLLDPAGKGVALKRDGKTFARIGLGLRTARRRTARARELRSEALRRSSFSIGMLPIADQCDWSAQWDGEQPPPSSGISESTPGEEIVNSPVDYLALGGAQRSTTTKRWGIAHAPGSLQGLGPHESGPRGATLVAVDQDGTVHCEFVPTAAVRWERWSVPWQPATSREEFDARCREVLAHFRPEAGELGWIFEWTLHGIAPAWGNSDAPIEAFQHALRQLHPSIEGGRVAHAVRRTSDPAATIGTGDLFEEYLAALAAQQESTAQQSAILPLDVRLSRGEVADDLPAALAELARRIDPAAIHAHAVSWGREKLGGVSAVGVTS